MRAESYRQLFDAWAQETLADFSIGLFGKSEHGGFHCGVPEDSDPSTFDKVEGPAAQGFFNW